MPTDSPRPRVVPGLPGHAAEVCGRLRRADYAEVAAATGRDPDRVLMASWEKSIYRWAIVRRDEVIGVFGVAPYTLMGRTGAPWLLGTDGMQRIKLRFVRESVTWVSHMLRLYPVLANWVDTRNRLSIKWLRWLGFEIKPEPEPFGAERRPFYYFEKRRDAHV